MRAPFLFALCIVSGAAPIFAQTQKPSGTANPAVSTARMLWEQPTQYITTVAEELPESTYTYRPTAAVRSFGQLIGHVAGAQYFFCAAALGEPARAEDEIERTRTTKADLVAALKASTGYCARAYGQTDRAA